MPAATDSALVVPAGAEALLTRFQRPDVCLARVLCDGHPPDRTAVRILEADLTARDMTYGELRDRSERFAAALAELGVGPGDRVATLMGKSPDLLTAVLGIWRRGAVYVPLFTAFAAPAVEMRLRAADAKVIVVDQGQREKLGGLDGAWRTIVSGGHAETGEATVAGLIGAFGPGIAAESVGGDAPFIMIFTSGTTGAPKGVPTPVRAIGGMCAYLEYGLGITGSPGAYCPTSRSRTSLLRRPSIAGSVASQRPCVLRCAASQARVSRSTKTP